MSILTHKVIGLDEHGEDPKCLGVYDTEESAQRVADSWNLIWDNCNWTYALPMLLKTTNYTETDDHFQPLRRKSCPDGL